MEMPAVSMPPGVELQPVGDAQGEQSWLREGGLVRSWAIAAFWLLTHCSVGLGRRLGANAGKVWQEAGLCNTGPPGFKVRGSWRDGGAGQ